MDLETLKKLLGITDATKDTLLTIVIGSVEELIKNYCNIKEVPAGLQYTAYRMAMDIYRQDKPGTESLSSTTTKAGGLASVTVGDTTVTYDNASSSSSQSASTVFYDSVLKDYEKTLKRYRRVTFT